MVVIPAMLTERRVGRELAHRPAAALPRQPRAPRAVRAAHRLGRRRHGAADADDAALLGAARRSEIERAQRALPGDAGDEPPRFLLLHRERRFAEPSSAGSAGSASAASSSSWSARWPRAARAAFLDLGAPRASPPDTRYVVTLDSDTRLPPGRLRELVGVAAHPHNQPRLDRPTASASCAATASCSRAS